MDQMIVFLNGNRRNMILNDIFSMIFRSLWSILGLRAVDPLGAADAAAGARRRRLLT